MRSTRQLRANTTVQAAAPNRKTRLLGAVVAVVIAGCVPAALGQPSDETYPLFASVEGLRLRIEGPFRELSLMNRDRPEFAGRLTYRADTDDEITLDVAMRIRGNSRLERCRFPPLRLDFVRRQLGETIFAGQNRLKLVNLCKREDRHRDYLGLEYSIYRMFNVLSEYSFRVRWASIEYVYNDDRRGRTFTEPAFFIEEDWEVAARHGMGVVELDRLSIDQLDRKQTALLGLFHFAIGNTDWAGLRGSPGEPCCHNGKLIGLPESTFILLPYDFDQSGLINAEYAQPSPALPIRSVTQRFYRGYCAVNSEIDWAIAYLNDSRPALEQVLAASPASQRSKDRALAYLGDSFEIINDSERRQDEIVEKCRG